MFKQLDRLKNCSVVVKIDDLARPGFLSKWPGGLYVLLVSCGENLCRPGLWFKFDDVLSVDNSTITLGGCYDC